MPDLSQLLGITGDHVGSGDPHRPADIGVRRQQAQQGEAENAFTRTGFTHQAQDLAGRDTQRDPAQRMNGLPAARKRDVQIADAARRRALEVRGVVVDDRAHDSEHSLEVQLPFIIAVLGDVASHREERLAHGRAGFGGQHAEDALHRRGAVELTLAQHVPRGRDRHDHRDGPQETIGAQREPTQFHSRSGDDADDGGAYTVEDGLHPRESAKAHVGG